VTAILQNVNGGPPVLLWAEFDQTTWLYTLAIVVPVGIVLVGLVVWGHSRAEFLLQQWASRNDLRIVEKKGRKIFRGPFMWNSSRTQMVYRVTVEDRDCNTYSGFVRLGSWVWGIFSDEAEVKWD
jgi:hypothetical protein